MFCRTDMMPYIGPPNNASANLGHAVAPMLIVPFPRLSKIFKGGNQQIAVFL